MSLDIDETKLENLRDILRGLGRVAIAFSGGVDSTFLTKVAHDTLGDNALAITIRSNVVPAQEMGDAIDFCTREGIRHVVLDEDALSIKGFAENPEDRCYICKKSLFTEMSAIAAREHATLIDGTNADDLSEWRPGLKALEELGIQGPLAKAGITKAEVRAYSHALGLPTWDHPSAACLASRIPFGEIITPEKLAMAERGEVYLHDHGFSQLRVRVHGDLARIEVEPQEIMRVVELATQGDLVARFHEIGFRYITVDMDGYRSGSLNPEDASRA